jgi:cysteine synthase
LLNGAAARNGFRLNGIARFQGRAADPRVGLEERIEAFEDIIDSEVGDTVLSRARNIEREFGLRQIYLKFDGGNPTGTQKDRIAFAQAMDALRRGFDAITVATCGNYGAALGLAAKLAGLKCYLCIPEAYHTRRLTMTRSGNRVLEFTAGSTPQKPYSPSTRRKSSRAVARSGAWPEPAPSFGQEKGRSHSGVAAVSIIG